MALIHSFTGVVIYRTPNYLRPKGSSYAWGWTWRLYRKGKILCQGNCTKKTVIAAWRHALSLKEDFGLPCSTPMLIKVSNKTVETKLHWPNVMGTSIRPTYNDVMYAHELHLANLRRKK